MLLALDVGNTNITIGIFEGERLTHNWRLRTIHEQTSDEWGILVRNLLALSGLETEQMDGIIIASVVPMLDQSLARMATRYFSMDALFVTPQVNTGIRICYDNPNEVGADRVVNAVAAYAKYGGPCIVVDLGTAITFDVVSRNAEYLGGIICPGIGISTQALITRTARLPMVAIKEPAKLIGTNTVGSIESGLYHGSVGMIDGILEKLIAEMGPETTPIATGGQAHLIMRGSRFLKALDEDLTLEGLRLIWAKQ
jgi:type III pantothenate kinase